MKTTLRLMIVSLAGYGAYTLWIRYGSLLDAPFDGRFDADRLRNRPTPEFAVMEWEAGVPSTVNGGQY